MSSSISANTFEAVVTAMAQQGKVIEKKTWTELLQTLAFLPVWLATVIPLTAVYQVVRFSLSLITPHNPQERPPLDSGHVIPDPSKIPARKDRPYDVIILGATGFTGSLAALHMAKTYGVGKSVKWALAGRSKSKLDTVKRQLADQLRMEEIMTGVDTLIVDTMIPDTLPALVSQTRVVATTAGPFAFYGNYVVEFCAKYGTHYVDTTGETHWAKNMRMMWQSTAQASGARLVSFCGNDCIPWDLSAMKMAQLMAKECPHDAIRTFSFWDNLNATLSGGTLATIASKLEMRAMSDPSCAVDPFDQLPNGQKSSHILTPRLWYMVDRARSPWKEANGWTIPFILADVNANIVRWSYALHHKGHPKAEYREYNLLPDFKTAITNLLRIGYMISMRLNPLTARWLPEPGQGPSPADMEQKFFSCILGLGVGVHGSRVETIFFTPKDPFYLETARMLMESALCLALSEDQLPRGSDGQDSLGGFWTPWTGLGDILLERLIQTGTYFGVKVAHKAPE